MDIFGYTSSSYNTSSESEFASKECCCFKSASFDGGFGFTSFANFARIAAFSSIFAACALPETTTDDEDDTIGCSLVSTLHNSRTSFRFVESSSLETSKHQTIEPTLDSASIVGSVADLVRKKTDRPETAKSEKPDAKFPRAIVSGSRKGNHSATVARATSTMATDFCATDKHILLSSPKGVNVPNSNRFCMRLIRSEFDLNSKQLSG